MRNLRKEMLSGSACCWQSACVDCEQMVKSLVLRGFGVMQLRSFRMCVYAADSADVCSAG